MFPSELTHTAYGPPLPGHDPEDSKHCGGSKAQLHPYPPFTSQHVPPQEIWLDVQFGVSVAVGEGDDVGVCAIAAPGEIAKARSNKLAIRTTPETKRDEDL